MSDLSDILAVGLSVLSDLKSEAVGYRTGTSGAFTALPGWVLSLDRVQPAFHDGDGAAEVQRRTGTLKGPLGTPTMAAGYQVQDAAGQIYAIQGVKIDQQQVCLVEQVDVREFTPDRGGAR